MAADLHYFPLLAGDWLAGEAVSMMLPEQEGAFIHLLCHAWQSKALACSLPNDDAALAQLSRLGDRWATAGPLVRAQFQEVNGDTSRLRNPKLWAIWKDAQAKHKKRVQAGRTGGVAKAKARAKQTSTNAVAMLEQYPSNQNQNQSHSKKRLKATTSPGGVTSNNGASNGQHPETWPAEGARLWREKVGPIEVPHFGKALKLVVAEHGWPLAREALLTYIDLNAGKARKPEWFRDDSVRWIKLAKMPVVDPVTRELTEKGRMA